MADLSVPFVSEEATKGMEEGKPEVRQCGSMHSAPQIPAHKGLVRHAHAALPLADAGNVT